MVYRSRSSSNHLTPSAKDAMPSCQEPRHSTQVLLVSSTIEEYFCIQTYLRSADLNVFELDWIQDYSQVSAKLTGQKYDICLLVDQPGTDFSLDVLRDIQTFDQTIILLTTDSNPAIAMEAMSLGAAQTLQISELSASLLERTILYAIHQEQRVSLLRSLLQAGFKDAQSLEMVPPPPAPMLRDTLTNLPDRNSFLQQIWAALGTARHQPQTIALLWLTVDRLKEINANHGWELGDGLLQAIGERLRQHVHPHGQVARLGGEAFGILLTNLPDEHSVRSWIHSILAEVCQPYWVHEQAVHIQVRIGVSLSPQHSRTPNDLLAHAQAANHTCQQYRQQFYQIYNTALSTLAMERQLIEVNLSQALERSQFQLHYQPQIDVQTGEILGIEALLRWHHPELGEIPPSVFIPIAEETGFILPLSQWIFQTACAQMSYWQRLNAKPLHLSINLSARQLQQDNLFALITQTLVDTQLDPRQLVLELTETNLISNIQAAVTTLHRLKEWGIQIAIDDFGTGFSSLHYLSSLPIDILKIDQSFVQQYGNNAKAESIISYIIKMAHSLEVQVIAEGVETQAQLEFLKAHGCYAIQGNFYSPALSNAEIMPLFSQKFSSGNRHNVAAH
jgi:diguanylate cyclase